MHIQLFFIHFFWFGSSDPGWCWFLSSSPNFPTCVLLGSRVQDQLRGVRKIQATRCAFAAVDSDGRVVTWGEQHLGGNCTYVQDRLINVEDVQATSGAFAAILTDGRVVTWGHWAKGGDSDSVQHQLQRVQRVQATQWLGGFKHQVFLSSPKIAQKKRWKIPTLTALTIGRSAFAAILSDQTVVAWGDPCAGGDCHWTDGQVVGPKGICQCLLFSLELLLNY